MKCKLCGYYTEKDSGVGYLCPNCNAPGSMERCEYREMHDGDE